MKLLPIFEGFLISASWFYVGFSLWLKSFLSWESPKKLYTMSSISDFSPSQFGLCVPTIPYSMPNLLKYLEKSYPLTLFLTQSSLEAIEKWGIENTLYFFKLDLNRVVLLFLDFETCCHTFFLPFNICSDFSS